MNREEREKNPRGMGLRLPPTEHLARGAHAEKVTVTGGRAPP